MTNGHYPRGTDMFSIHLFLKYMGTIVKMPSGH